MPITPDGPITDSPITPDSSSEPIKPDGPISDSPITPDSQSTIKPDGPISDKAPPITPDGPISHLAPDPVHTPHTFDAQINTVSKQYGLNPRIMQAIGMQESGLGTGGNYNASTGRDKDSNQGVSPWQLDPASGIPKSQLDKAAKDPAYAAALSAKMMKQNMAATGGNLREALSMYNSGSRTSPVGLAYADSVLKQMGSDDQLEGSPSLMEKVKHDAQIIAHAVTHGQPITAKTMGHLQTTKPLHDLEVHGIQAWDEIRHHPIDAISHVMGLLSGAVGTELHESVVNPTGLDPAKMQQHLHAIWDYVTNPTPKREEQATSGLGEAVNRVGEIVSGHKTTIVPSHMQIDNWVRQTLHSPKVFQPYLDGLLETGEDITEQTLTGGPGAIGKGLVHSVLHIPGAIDRGITSLGIQGGIDKGLIHIGLHAPAVVARAAHAVAQAMGVVNHFPHLLHIAQAHTALADAFVARRDLDRAGLTEKGKKVRLAIENKHINANPDDAHAATRGANKEFAQLAKQNPGELHTGNPDNLKRLGIQDNSNVFRAMRIAETHNPLTGIAKLGKKAILWNPIPHGLVNVGTLTYQAGGLAAVFSGFRHMIKPAEGVEERLQSMGGMQDYIDPTNNKFFKAGNDLLHRMEVGWRSGLLEQLDKKLGPSAAGSTEEYLKGHLISNRVGDYRNQSAFVKMFQALGGPFVAFGLGIVPQQFLKTLKEDPDRIYKLLQTQRDVQSNRQGKRRNTLEFSNPTTDAVKFLTDPVHYLASPSRTGPIAELFGLKEDEDQGKYEGLGQRGIDLAQAYLPTTEALGKAYGAASGQNMPGQKMSIVDRLADAVEEELFNMFYQKPEKPKTTRAEKKKISKEVGF